MRRSMIPTLLVAALAAAWSAGAQAADAQVAPAEAGRVAMAVDASNPARLAIGSRSPSCWSGFAAHLSDDDGATWRHGCTMWGTQDDEAPTDSPAVAFDSAGVLIAVQPMYWDSDGGSLRAARSSNGGQSWDGWYTVGYSQYLHGSILNAQVEVDNAAASPNRGTVYASFTDDGWDVGSLSRIRVARSADGGRHWSSVSATPEATGDEQLDFSDLAIDRRGNLFLSYMSCTGPQAECRGQAAELRLTRSTDGGQSWSAPAKLAAIQLPAGKSAIDTRLNNDYGALPETKAAVSFSPVIAVDATEGAWQNRLYAVMTTYADKRLQVLLSSSDDQGATWSAPRPVAAGPRAADQFMPWVSVSRQGVVAVTWMDQRQHPKQPGYQAMVAFSKDGGATFGAPALLQGDASQPGKLKDLRGSASHAWTGKRLKTTFIGPDAAGKASLRLSTTKP